MTFLDAVRLKVKDLNKTIVFPEGNDARVLMAANYLQKEGILDCLVLGNADDIKQVAGENHVDLEVVQIVDPAASEYFESFANTYFQLRKHKNISRQQSIDALRNPLFYGAMMVRENQCDGSVAGAVNTTGDVLRAAIQIIGLAPGIELVSSTFEMVFDGEKVLTYADCAVVPQPDPLQLADIAISSAETHKKLTGKEPYVALLSFSTKGSAKHEMVDKVQEAVAIAKSKQPDLKIDGDLQVDAAIVTSIGERKAPGSPVAGKANVFIFPDLNAGNIAYKITERLAGARAVGPIIQGLAKPANDLSRGCSWKDIVDVACICSLLN